MKNNKDIGWYLDVHRACDVFLFSIDAMCVVASYWHCHVASLSTSMSTCGCPVYLGERCMYQVTCFH